VRRLLHEEGLTPLLTIRDKVMRACHNVVVGRLACLFRRHQYDEFSASFVVDAEVLSRMCACCLDVHVIWLEGDSLSHWHSRAGA
jgi:hypothetical protein